METVPPTTISNYQIDTLPALTLPTIITDAGDKAAFRFVEFFTATIRNKNTRAAYFNAVQRFCTWCDLHGLELRLVNPVHVAAYIEQLGQKLSIPTVKQHLSAINRLMDFLVTGQVIPINPAHSVTAPKYVANRGKTPVLSAEKARTLLASIDTAPYRDSGAARSLPSWSTALPVLGLCWP